MPYVPARPSAVQWQQQIARSATRTSCRGCVGVRRRKRTRHAVLRQCMRGVHGGAAAAARGAHAGGARAMRRRRCGGRACATAASYAPSLLHRCATSRGVALHRSVCGRREAVGGTALPGVVRDALGAADEQLRSGADAAVHGRYVQRCESAGRGGHGCMRRTIDHRRQRAERAVCGKAHPWVFSVASTSARAPSSAATIARSSLIAAHINAVTPPLHKAGPAEGVGPRSGVPSHG